MSEIVLTIHFIIVLFFIAGFFIGLSWNQPMFRYIHAGSLGGITLLMILGIPCPLTLEWFDPSHVLIADVLFMALVLSSFWWYPVKK